MNRIEFTGMVKNPPKTGTSNKGRDWCMLKVVETKKDGTPEPGATWWTCFGGGDCYEAAAVCSEGELVTVVGRVTRGKPREDKQGVMREEYTVSITSIGLLHPGGQSGRSTAVRTAPPSQRNQETTPAIEAMASDDIPF